MKTFQEERKTGAVEQKPALAMKEAAEYIGVSQSTLYKMTSSRAITFYKPNNGKIYFRTEDLNKWMLQNEVKSVTQREEELTAKINKDGK